MPVARLTRYLEWEMRSRYDKETVQYLLWMIHYRHKGETYVRALVRLAAASLFALLAIVLTPTQTPAKWYGLGIATAILVPVMGWLIMVVRRTAHAHTTLWNRYPGRWESVISELAPLEQEHRDSPVISIPLTPLL